VDDVKMLPEALKVIMDTVGIPSASTQHRGLGSGCSMEGKRWSIP
jgi:hypothetical protein